MRSTTMLLATAAAVLPLTAQAQCAPPAAGFTVCNGTDPDGFDASDGPDGLVVEVRPGAVVASPGDALELADDARVLNEGSIDAGDEAVVGGVDLVVENRGAIAAADNGVDVDDADGLTVVNAGSIEAGDKAITAGDGARARLDNTGTVRAGSEGFEAGDDAVVTNAAGASIVAGEDAVQVGRGAFIDNDGLIEALAGDEGDGIDIDDGTILNTGSIVAADGAGIDFDGVGPDDGPVGEAAIDNAGLIEGVVGVQVELGSDEDPANTAGQTIFNAGVLRGTGGTAIELGAGDDTVVAVLGGLIDGDTLLGEGEDALLFHRDPDQVVEGVFGLFDGGAGADEVQFNNFDAAGLRGRAVEGGFDLLLFEGGASLSATLIGFESFAFADATLTAADLASVAPIPVPASLPLLGAGVAGLVVLRRRARR